MKVPSTPSRGARPDCHWCGKPLPAFKWFAHPDIDPAKQKKWGRFGNGIFCTLRCGFDYGVSTVLRSQ